VCYHRCVCLLVTSLPIEAEFTKKKEITGTRSRHRLRWCRSRRPSCREKCSRHNCWTRALKPKSATRVSCRATHRLERPPVRCRTIYQRLRMTPCPKTRRTHLRRSREYESLEHQHIGNAADVRLSSHLTFETPSFRTTHPNRMSYLFGQMRRPPASRRLGEMSTHRCLFAETCRPLAIRSLGETQARCRAGSPSAPHPNRMSHLIGQMRRPPATRRLGEMSTHHCLIAQACRPLAIWSLGETQTRCCAGSPPAPAAILQLTPCQRRSPSGRFSFNLASWGLGGNPDEHLKFLCVSFANELQETLVCYLLISRLARFPWVNTFYSFWLLFPWVEMCRGTKDQLHEVPRAQSGQHRTNTINTQNQGNKGKSEWGSVCCCCWPI